MKIETHLVDGRQMIEIVSDQIIVKNAQDALDLIANLPLPHNKLILHKQNISPDFFDLKSGVAGEILQKIVNYRIQLAIVGDFSNVTSTALRAFIIESNRGHTVCFVESLEEAQKFLLR